MAEPADSNLNLQQLSAALKGIVDGDVGAMGIDELFRHVRVGHPAISAAVIRCMPALTSLYGYATGQETLQALCDIVYDGREGTPCPRGEQLLALPEEDLDEYVLQLAVKLRALRQKYEEGLDELVVWEKQRTGKSDEDDGDDFDEAF